MIGCLGDKVETFLGYTDVGSQFVYGYLATDIVDDDGIFYAPAVFYFKVGIDILIRVLKIQGCARYRKYGLATQSQDTGSVSKEPCRVSLPTVSLSKKDAKENGSPI